jgi:diguanylate cyclase (GGDEF)-like protein
MNNIKTREIIVIYAINLLIVLAFFIWPMFYGNQNIDSVEIGPTEFSDGTQDLSYRLKDDDEPIINHYSTTLNKADLSSLDSENLWLVISRFDSQGYMVWWNDHYIGANGDITNGRANIWNSSEIFRVCDDYILENNTLNIVTHSQYDIGISDGSIQIADEQDAQRIHKRYELFSTQLTFIALGIAILAFIFSAVIIFLNRGNKINIAIMMAVLSCIFVYSLESLDINFLSTTYLVFKKYIIGSLFVAVFLAGLMVRSLIKKKYPAYVGFVTLIIFIVGTYYCKDMLTFKKFYNMALLLLPVNLFVYIIAIIPKVKTDTNAKILIGGMGVFAFITGWETIANNLFPTMLITSPFPLIMVVASALILFIANAMIQRNRELESETKAKTHFYNKSIKDELTGLYNKEYCSMAIKQRPFPFTVAMMDIDDFKLVNDNFGHTFGDFVVKRVARIMKEVTRDKDIIGRFGGDEFILALMCGGDEAFHVFERLLQKISSDTMTYYGKHADITVSIGIYQVDGPMPVKAMIHNADIALYEAKTNGKNRISVYKKTQD